MTGFDPDEKYIPLISICLSRPLECNQPVERVGRPMLGSSLNILHRRQQTSSVRALLKAGAGARDKSTNQQIRVKCCRWYFSGCVSEHIALDSRPHDRVELTTFKIAGRKGGSNCHQGKMSRSVLVRQRRGQRNRSAKHIPSNRIAIYLLVFAT